MEGITRLRYFCDKPLVVLQSQTHSGLAPLRPLNAAAGLTIRGRMTVLGHDLKAVQGQFEPQERAKHLDIRMQRA
jgi:hypothetical protein